VTDAFTYAELDEILRGTGRNGAIGISAIDGCGFRRKSPGIPG
jgi:hypothetical protein